MKQLLRKGLLLFLLTIVHMALFAQAKTITGKIVDEETKSPLEDVIIRTQNGKNATKSKADGTFSLSIQTDDNVLMISYVGYEKQEFRIGNSSIVNVSLKPSEQSLKDVVVVAYGEASKRQMTGSVAKVSAKQLENVPMSSLDLILQGTVPGLQVSSYSGQPGGQADVRIRGIGSITAGSNPLYVVDGIPINSGTLGNGLTWTSNSLAGINPNDIESISVLKDAAATAIYGSRGGNGVIIITTKKGKAGKTKFRFDTDYGINKLAFNKLAKPLNASQYRTLTYEGLINAGYTDSAAQDQLNSIGANDGHDTRWLDEVTQTGAQNSYNLSVSGGDERTQFFLSGGYFKQQGTTIQSGFNRHSGSFKLQHRVNDRLKLNTNLMLSSSRQKTPYQSAYFRSPITSAYFLLPFASPYDSTGEVNMDNDVFFMIFNPVAIAKLDNNYLKNTKVIGGLGGEYNIMKGLVFSSKLNLDLNLTKEMFYMNPFYGDADFVSGSMSMANTSERNMVWTNMFSYHRDLMKNKAALDIKAGHEAQESEREVLYAYGEGFPLNTSIQVLSAAANPKGVSSSISQYAFESYFSNLSFSLHSKYLFSASFRRDGSSRFGSKTRFGNFYSIGGSWILSEEDFLKNNRYINVLRLRGSYGRNGNANIDNYVNRATYGFGANYNGAVGIAPNTPGNDRLTWEKNSPLDIGLDATLLNNRLNLTIDWYHRKTSDLLLNVPVSQTSGFTEQLSNIGAMVNNGLEVTLDGTIIKSRNFNWNANFNIAFNKNKITALYKDQEFQQEVFIYRVGESVQSFYLPIWAGVDPQNGDALWYTDSTKTAKTNDYTKAKRAIAGNTQPKFFGALTNSLTYKNISLSFQFNYVYGNHIYRYWSGYFVSDGANPLVNQTTEALDRWQKPGDVTNTPKYVYDNTSRSNNRSTRYMFDGTYLRLRNISLSYSVPSRYLKRHKVNSLGVYLRATNLLTWAKDKRITFDPDVSDGTTDMNLPNMKSLIMGINLEF